MSLQDKFKDPRVVRSAQKSESDKALELLRKIDEGSKDVSEWEANFLESVFNQEFPLTSKQLEVADSMINKHL